MLARSDSQGRAGRFAYHFFRNTPQQHVSDHPLAVTANNNQIDVVLLRVLDNLVERCSRLHDSLDGYAYVVASTKELFELLLLLLFVVIAELLGR